ncbi:hypothetical protein L6216_01530 [Pseudomonas syringae pv. syringae]|nr:hypothetical protein [Pseudomonas syringae]MCH5532851.1 hypothetical protein [Pseudomonas syringae pv. syringae]
MRNALFGSGGFGVHSAVQNPPSQVVITTTKRGGSKSFMPKLIVTLRVCNEFEDAMELITLDADTLSSRQAQVDAMKHKCKKYRYVELVSVRPVE